MTSKLIPLTTTGLAVGFSTWLCLGFTESNFVTNNGVLALVQTTQPDPTNHFDWMPKLFPDDCHNPEWNYIPFGNNPVRWLTFRRGIYGNKWNGWEPAPATALNAVILQSSFEPVVTKTNGVWIITFKR